MPLRGTRYDENGLLGQWCTHPRDPIFRDGRVGGAGSRAIL